MREPPDPNSAATPTQEEDPEEDWNGQEEMITGTNTEWISELSTTDEINCECMVCHLPPGMLHSPVSWKLTLDLLGNFTEPGPVTMLLCEECFQDWVENAAELDAQVVTFHRI